MNSKSTAIEFIVAKEKYDKFRRKIYGEIHDPICTLNRDPKEILINHNYIDNGFNSSTCNANTLGKSRWKPKGKEDDFNEDNCCQKNMPCTLVDFQLEKIKQWMNKNWDRITQNSDDLKEMNHDFRTYFANQKLSVLSLNHQIQLYRVGTFSNEPCCINELQNDRYDGEAYLKKFKTFGYFSMDASQFYGGNIRLCKPLEFELSCSSKEVMTMKYQGLMHSMPLPKIENTFETNDKLG
jgi:hypothetical protein